MRKSITLLATAALTLAMTACSAPLETITDPATHKTTSPAIATAEVVEDTRPLLVRMEEAGVPVFNIENDTLTETSEIICKARDRGVPHWKLLEVTNENMTMWQPVDSEKYLHFVYSEVCPTLTDPATSTRK